MSTSRPAHREDARWERLRFALFAACLLLIPAGAAAQLVRSPGKDADQLDRNDGMATDSNSMVGVDVAQTVEVQLVADLMEGTDAESQETVGSVAGADGVCNIFVPCSDPDCDLGWRCFVGCFGNAVCALDAAVQARRDNLRRLGPLGLDRVFLSTPLAPPPNSNVTLHPLAPCLMNCESRLHP